MPLTEPVSATLAERLATHVHDLSYDDLPAAVVAKVKEVINHDLAVVVAGRLTDEAGHALALIRGQVGGHQTVVSTVIGEHRLDGTYDMLEQVDSVSGLTECLRPGGAS
jgi:hypothetical protein